MAEASHRALVRGLFGLVGLGAGVAGGWYAHDRTSSWALAVFVLVITSAVIGRGVADVITDPEKGRRAEFFGLPPALAVASLALSYWLWGTWWLSVTIGFILYFIGYAVAMVAFPRIAQEEYEDDLERMGTGRRLHEPRGGQGPFIPSDLNKF